MRGPKGAIESLFSNFGKSYYFFVLKSILWYVKDVSITEPTLMGGPKGMGGEFLGNCTIEVIFVMNRNFLNKYSENQKILMKKMSSISNFTYAVQISSGSVKK